MNRLFTNLSVAVLLACAPVAQSQDAHFNSAPAQQYNTWDELQEGVLANDPVALRVTAQCYENGIQVTQDFHKAFAYYQKAAEKGDAFSQHAVGFYYHTGQGGIKQNQELAVQWTLKAAEQGHPSALFTMGLYYEQGDGKDWNPIMQAPIFTHLPKDEAKAVEWYTKAAEKGHAKAMSYMGQIYFYGKGNVPQNLEAGKEWLRRAAELGELEAIKDWMPIIDPEHEHEWYVKAAQLGDLRSLVNVGYGYELGQKVPQNLLRALDIYHQAAARGSDLAKWHINELINRLKTKAEQGDAEAQFLVAAEYLKTNTNPAEALRLLESAAAKKYAPALSQLGVMYSGGIGVTKDEQKGFELKLQAAELGDKIAMYNVGFDYEFRQKNRTEALKWYLRAAEKNVHAALYALGVWYLGGIEVEKNEAKTVEFLNKASEAGSADAQYLLGNFYWKGRYVGRDFDKAARLYQAAATQGHIEALCMLGFCHNNGYGLPKNPVEAYKCFSMAAERGDAEAQFQLAIMCQADNSQPNHKQTAVSWLKKAAAQNHPPAQFVLGTCYWNGDGVQWDYAEALRWIKAAAEQGYPDAVRVLNELNSEQAKKANNANQTLQ